MNTGIYEGMSFEDYRKIEAVNNSTIADFAKSPDTCLLEKSGDALRFGRAFHTLILEPDKFPLEYAVMPEGMTRAQKAYKEDFVKSLQGREEVSNTEYKTMQAMRGSIYSGKYNTAKHIIEKARKELTVVWDDKQFGCKCKARIDLEIEDLGLLADLKTCQTADPQAWLAGGLKMGKPHFQPYWYIKGINSAIGEVKYNTFLWILIEKTEPYRVTVLKATPAQIGDVDMLAVADAEVSRLLPKYLEAKQTNKWTGNPDCIIDAEFPQWYANKYS